MPDIPEPYATILQAIVFIYFLYYLIRNRGRIEETDRSLATRKLFSLVIPFLIVSCCIIFIVFYDDPVGRETLLSISKWILLVGILVGLLYIEFKYGRNKEIHQNSDTKGHS